MEKDVKQRVLAYLKDHNTMTLATSLGDRPWAAALFYASDGLNLYFLSDPETLHVHNMAANPKVAVTINEDYHDWKKIKGIQLEGEGKLIIDEGELAKAVAVYVDKYPFVATYLKVIMSPFAGIARFLDRFIEKLPFPTPLPSTAPTKFYKITPHRAWFIDNEIKFGHREEFPL